VWAFGSAMLMYTMLARTMGLRATTLDEQRGLDYTEHHEIGYPEFQTETVNRGKAMA
jgi:Amt family ammonium transporter